MELSIRIGNIADLDALIDFQKKMAFESEGLTLDSGLVRKGVSGVLTDENKGSYLVACEGKNPVACLLVTTEWSDWTGTWYWWIQSVYVDREYRGKGIYKALYNKVKELAAAKGVRNIRLYADKENLNARKVYEKLGMQESHYLMFEEKI